MSARRALGAAILLVVLTVVPAQAKAIGGVVPDVPTRAHLHRAPLARIANLGSTGGVVLHSNRVHVIFWEPAGSNLHYDPGYTAFIDTFLANVAADKRKPTNVYGLSGQYFDSGGPAAYDVSWAGSVLATNHLPPNDCVQPATGPGWLVCVQDSDLAAEISHVIAVDHLPTTAHDLYILATPNGFGSCISTGPDHCALGGSGSGYCGYHGNIGGTILYAVIPYNAVFGHCQSDNPRPNGSTADPAVSTMSHEHNEIVTDPFGDAWVDPSGLENGDLCVTDFGPGIGGAGSTTWNEAIHGGHYFLQEEWSNDSGSCQPRDESDRVSLSKPHRVRVGKAAPFAAHARDPDGKIERYRWLFGDGGKAHHRTTSHTFKHPGVYRVVLRTTDNEGNWAFAVRTVRVK